MFTIQWNNQSNARVGQSTRSTKRPQHIAANPIQLKSNCACGGGCLHCQLKARAQSKMNIGSADDRYEKEADRVAAQVVQMPGPIDRNPFSDRPRMPGTGQTSVHTKQNNPDYLPSGQPLSNSERAFFETRFQQDFSEVRVHTDSAAARSAEALNAKAYTQGNHLVFAKGEYDSNSQSGKQLIAHELTHVVQQSGGSDRHVNNPISQDSTNSVRLFRHPDRVFNGHYSFNLIVGGGSEIAVQFHYPGSGNDVTVRMASLRRRAMVEATYTLSNPTNFAPVVSYEDGTTTTFDLEGDGSDEIQVHVTMDAINSAEFLTSTSNPGDPEYVRREQRETFALMEWPGIERIVRFRSGFDSQAWVTRPHPHPHINFVYYNTVTREYFIPSQFTLSSQFRGVRTASQAIVNQDVTVLDWGESWNGFNVAGGVLTYNQIDADSVENMVESIQQRITQGSCINTLTIIGHGLPGSISVGGGTTIIEGRHIRGGALDSTSGFYDANLARLLARLTPLFCRTGQVVLRGCNVGDGALGAAFVQNLANLWRVPVRAHVGTVRGGGYWITGNWRDANPQ